MTIATELMDKKAASLLPPSLEGDGQQCVTARLGEDVTLTMQLADSGGTATDITWTRGEQELVGDRYRFSENNNTVHLSLQHVTHDDVGYYTLIAKNGAGEARGSVELRVDDAPAFLRRLSDLAVKVGTRTRFLVEIRSSSDVKVTWHRNDRLVLEDDRFSFVHEGNFFCVDVAPVMVEDGGRWTCMAENSTGRSSCSSHLNVLVPKAYKVPEFLEELKALLTELGTVSLECKVVGVPTPVLHWYKDGKEIKAGDVFALTANADDPTSLGTYTCEAVNCMGKTYSSSRVHVVGKGSREGSLKPADSLHSQGPPPLFTTELRPEKTKIGDTLTLMCKVAVPPWPKNIAWYNHEGRVDASDKYHVMEDGLGGYMLEVNAVEAADEGEWKCVATSAEGAMGISKTQVVVSYPKNFRKPRFLESLKAILTEEGLVSFECKVVGFPTPMLRWFKDGQELRPGDVYQLTGTNSLGSYSCIAKNCMGEASSSAELTVEDIQNQLNEEERLQLFSTNQPPKFVRGLKSSEGKIGDDFRLTVQVSISPEPTVAWYRDDEHVIDCDRYSLCKEMLGLCHLDIRCLEILDQAEWKCVATNDFGHSVTSCFLKLTIPKHFKKPRFLENLRAILSEEGAVNLECKVIGVPQPVLKWYKDGAELKPGDIHRIISGQDGTCCLGTYTCEATNCMGTVASSASLLGFEDRMLAKEQPRAETAGGPPGHVIARNPSLSTIHEERTSQMYDTPATERSLTVDERPEISFSFDGKEVSVSLYETPDLTEDEALQVVEMYADQLSEHVSEHNVVDLPPMRFVKESSHSGKLLMEAVIIDVTGDYFSTAEDDLRTDKDLEDLSIADEQGPQTPMLPPDLEDDDIPFDKLNAEFFERALAPTVPYPGSEDVSPPKRPPRKKSEPSRGTEPEPAKQSSDTYHSISPSKGANGAGKSPQTDDDRSEPFTDAQASEYDTPSKYETFASARGSFGKGRDEEMAYQVAAIEEQRTSDPQSTKSSPPELVRNTQVESKKRKDTELEQDEDAEKKMPEAKVERSTQAGSIKRKKRSVESGQGSSFENILDETERDQSGITQKGSQKSQSKSDEVKSESIEELANKKPAESTPVKVQEQDIYKVDKDESYSEEGDGLKTRGHKQPETDIQRKGSKKTEDKERSKPLKRKGSKRSPSVEAQEAKSEEEHLMQLTIQSELENIEMQKQESVTKKQRLSTAEIDLPRLLTPEESKEAVATATPKTEPSVLEALTQSLQDIQKGLASVEEKVISECNVEPGSAQTSLSVLETLSQPIQDIQKGLALVEQQSSSPNREYSPSKTEMILETLSQPIQEFHRGLQFVEQQVVMEGCEESFLERTSASILETVAQPVEELRRGIALIQQQAILEAGEEQSRGKIPALVQSEALQAILRPVHELQVRMAILQQQATLEVQGQLPSENSAMHILSTLEQPLSDLKRGVDLVEQQVGQEFTEPSDVNRAGISILEAVAQPIQELRRGIALVEQQAVIETEDGFEPDILKYSVLRTLSQPIQELQESLAQIKQTLTSEDSSEADTLEQSIQHVTREIVTIAKLAVLKGKSESKNLEILGNLAPPLLKLQKQLVQVEKNIVSEDVEDPKTKIPSLKLLTRPLIEFHQGLTKIGEQLVQESGKVSEEQQLKSVESLAASIKHLKEGVSIIQNDITSERSRSAVSTVAIDSLVQPFQEFQRGLVQIEQVVLGVGPGSTGDAPVVKALTKTVQDLESRIEMVEKLSVSNEQDSAVISKITNLAQPLLKLQKCLVQVCQTIQQDQPGRVLPVLGTLVQPLYQLQKGLDEIEQQYTNLESLGPVSKAHLLYVAEPIQELQQGILIVQRQAVLEPQSTSIAVLESLVKPLEELEKGLAGIKMPTSEKPGLVALQSVAKSIEALQQGIMSIEKHTVDEPNQASLSELRVLTEPLRELREELARVEQQGLIQSGKETVSEIITVSALKTLAEPLEELQKGVERIDRRLQSQEEHNVYNLQIKSLSEPIRELQKGIAVVQHQAVLESGVVTDKAGPSVLETLFHPLQKLQKSLVSIESIETSTCKTSSSSIIESMTQFVNDLQQQVEKQGTASISVVATLADPLKHLQRGLAQIEQSVLQEGAREPQSEIENLSALETLLQPLQHLKNNIIIVEEEQTSVEVNDPVAVKRATISALHTLSQPITELQKGIELIQQKALLETEPMYGKANVSILQILSQPLQEFGKGLSEIEDVKVTADRDEQITERLSVLDNVSKSIDGLQRKVASIEKCATDESKKAPKKSGLSILGTLNAPLLELNEGLIKMNEQIRTTTVSESLPEKATVSALESLAKPIQDLQIKLASLEKLALDPQAEPIAKIARASAVKAITLAVQELKKGVAVVQQQAVLESGALSISASKSMLGPLFKPLQKLQRCLSVVEESKLAAPQKGKVMEMASVMIIDNVSQSVQHLQTEVKQSAAVATVHTLSTPLLALQQGLNIMEHKIIESGTKSPPQRACLSAIETLAKPMELLVEKLVQIEHEPSAHETLAQPIQELRRSIAVVQQQTGGQELSILSTIAQPLQDLQKMLAVVEETVALEAESMSSFGALKTLAHPIEEIKQSIALIELQAVLEPSAEPMSHRTSMSVLQTLAKPLSELQTNMVLVEQQVALEAMEEPMSEKISVTMLKTIAAPVEELTKGIATIEQQALLETGDGSISETVSLTILKTLAKSVQDLQMGLAQVEQQVVLEAREEPMSEKTNVSLLKTLAIPVKELHKNIAIIEEHAVFDPREETMSEKSSMSMLKALAQPLDELERGLAQVEHQVLLEAGEEPLSEQIAVSILETLACPVQELQRSVALIQQQAALEADGQVSDDTTMTMLKTLASPIQELQRGLAQIEQQVVLEAREEPLSEKARVSTLETMARPVAGVQEALAVTEQQVTMEPPGEPMSSVSVLQTVAKPIEEMRKSLAQIEQQVALEAKEESMSDKTSLSILKTLALPMQQLQKSIAVIEQQTLMEPKEEPLSDEASVSALQTLAHPLQELQRSLAQIEEQVLLEAQEETPSPTIIKLLKPLAKPVEEMQRCIAFIEQQATLEAGEGDISEKASISVLQTLARPMVEFQLGLAQIEHQIALEAREEPMSDKTSISSLVTIAQPLQELQRNIAVIEQQTILEAKGTSLSEIASISMLKTLAQPLHELQQHLVQIEQQVLLESKEIPVCEHPSFTLAHPIQEIQRGIALIEQQMVLEDRGHSVADKSSIEILKALAKPIEELQRGIAVIEQQVVLDVREVPIISTNGASKLISSAKPVEELHKGVAVTEEQAILEAGGEALSDKASLSILETVAQPLQEVCKALSVIQMFPRGEPVSMEEEISALKTLAQPIQELQNCLAQIEQQVLLEPGVEQMSKKEGLSTLQTLAQPIQDIQQGIAVMEQQALCEASDRSQASIIRALAKPLQELQRGILLIAQQEALECLVEPISEDGTIRSDLPTLASSRDVSQNLSLVNVEEHFVLEGDVGTLSDRTDPKELESAVVSGTESQKKRALVQCQAAIQDQGETVSGFGSVSALQTPKDEATTAAMKDVSQKGLVVVQEQQMLSVADSLKDIPANAAEATALVDTTSERGIVIGEEQEVLNMPGRLEPYERGVSDKATVGQTSELKLAVIAGQEVLLVADEFERAQTNGIGNIAEAGLTSQLGLATAEQQQVLVEAGQVETPSRSMGEAAVQQASLLGVPEVQQVDQLQDEHAETLSNVESLSREEYALESDATLHEAAVVEDQEALLQDGGMDIAPMPHAVVAEEAEPSQRFAVEYLEQKPLSYVETLSGVASAAHTTTNAELKAETVLEERALIELGPEVLQSETVPQEMTDVVAMKDKEKEGSTTKVEKGECDRMKKEEFETGNEEASNELITKTETKENGDADSKIIIEETPEGKQGKEDLKSKKVNEDADQKEEHKKKEEEDKMKEEETKQKKQNELKRKEEGAEHKKKEQEDIELIKKEESQTEKKEEAKENKSELKEAETKATGEEAQLKKKEAGDKEKKEEVKVEHKIKEIDQIDGQNKEGEQEQTKKKERNSKKKREKAEIKTKEMEEAECNKKEKEQIEQNKENEADEKKKKEQDEEEHKRKEDETKKKKGEDDIKIKEIEETERKNKEEEKIKQNKKKEADTLQKAKDEADREKEKEKAEIKQKEDEKVEYNRRNEADEKSKKEKEDAIKEEEVKKKNETEEAERKKKQEEELEQNKKTEAEAKKKKEEEDKMKEIEEAERKRKQEEELKEKQKKVKEDKAKEEEEMKNKKEAEIKKKETEGAERKKKEEEELERKKKKEEDKVKEESEIKKKEAEETEQTKKKRGSKKMKEKDEAERKMKEEEGMKEEAEIKKKETEEAERKKKQEEELEQNKKKEAEVKQKKEEEDKLKEEAKKKKEMEEAERKKKQEEELEQNKKKDAEAKKKEEEDKVKEEAKKKKETEEAELKKKEEELLEQNKTKEAEARKKEEEDKLKEEDAKKKKEFEEAERKKKEELVQNKKKEAEAKTKEEEEDKLKEEKAIIKKNETEEAERKKKEEVELEQKKKKEEQKIKEEAETKKKETEETEQTKKKRGSKKQKEKEEAELKKKEMEEADRKKKQEEELEQSKKNDAKEKKKKEEEDKIKEEENKKKKEIEEAERKKIEEEDKAKEEEKMKKEAEIKEKETEEAERKIKETEETEQTKKKRSSKKKKEKDEAERMKEEEKKKEEAEIKKKEMEEAERKKKQEEELKQNKKNEEEARKKKEEEDKIKVEETKKKKEIEEAERKKKQEEELEQNKKKEEEAKKKKVEEDKMKVEEAKKKKEIEEAERKKKEEEDKAKEDKAKEEEEEIKKEAEIKEKETEEAERKIKETEETEQTKKKRSSKKKKEKDEAERMKEEERKTEEAEIKKKEMEEAERKKKQEEELEQNKKNEEEEARKKKEEEDKMKVEEAKKKKEIEEAERKKKQEEELEQNKKKEKEDKAKEEEDKRKKEEAEIKKKETEEAERKKKEEEELEQKKKKEEDKIKEEAEIKKKEEAEIKKKETEETEQTKKKRSSKKKKEKDEADRKMKEEERKKNEAEIKKKEMEEAERKKKQEEELEQKKKIEAEAKMKEEEDKVKEEEAKKKKEMEEEDRKKKQEEELEQNKKKEAEAKKKREEEDKMKVEEAKKKKEIEEAECKKKEEEELEQKKKKEEDKVKEEAQIKKKETEETEQTRKKRGSKKMKEKDEADRKMKEEERKKEEAEIKKKETEEAERKKKEEDELEQKKKKVEEDKVKEEEVKKKEEAEIKKKEMEEAEHKKKQEEELEQKKKKEKEDKAKEEEVRKKKEEAEIKKKETEEVERKKKETEETEQTKKKRSSKKKKEKDEADRKMKEEERKKEEAEIKKKEMEEAERKRKDEEVLAEQKMKEEAELKEKDQGEAERKRQENDEVKRKKSTNETESTKKVDDQVEGRKRESKGDVTNDGETRLKADSSDAGDGEDSPQWLAHKVSVRSRSFHQRPVLGDESAAPQTSLDSSDTLTTSDTSSTLTPLHRSKSRSRGRATEERSLAGMEDLPSDTSHRRRDRAEPRDFRKKPTFATRLTDRTAAQGSRIKLTCSVLGSPDPEVSWLRDGLPLELDRKFRAHCEDGLASLEVLDAAPGDSAEYTCVACNVHGENTSSATLKVYAGFEPAPFPPTFTRGIKDVYRSADDELVLECRVRSQPAPKITWLKNGVPLRASAHYQQSELADGVCRVVISNPESVDDSGLYTCRAENALWSDQISSAVAFTGREQHLASKRSERINGSRVPRDVRKPHFSSVLTDHLVPSGGTIALQVEVRGAPKPDVTWLRGGETLPGSRSHVRLFEEEGVHTLMVADAGEAEAGMYTCRASNTFGQSVTTAAVQVVCPGSVRGGRPAMFVNRPDNVMAVAVGEDISVSFRVSGDPKPRVTWMKGTRDITNSQRSLKETLDDYVRLTLKRALLSDMGTYCILAKNVYGCDRAFVTVRIRQRARSLTPGAESRLQETVTILRDVHDQIERTRLKDVPKAVSSEPVVSDSGRNWLTLSWPKGEQRGGVPVLAYRVESWELGDSGGARWTEMGVSPINSFDAFNLKPGREYKFRVTPRNRYGWGESVTTSTPVVVGRPVELPEFVRILPGQLKALRGANIRLECQVRGDPIPEVRWYRDGTELDFRRDPCPRFSTSFNGSACLLEIRALREEDSARYMCEATSREGRVSTFARLMVVSDPKIWEADTKLKRGILEDEGADADSPPQFTMRLRDRRVQMTYPVRLTCQVAGRPSPELVWSKDGAELKQDERHTFSNEEHFHTLEIGHASLDDSGSYSATARNANGAVSCRCHLVVDKGIRAYVAPEFVFELEPEFSVKEGGNLRLSAQVEAYPTVGVMWHRDGVRLRPSRHSIMTLDHDGTVELALAGVTSRDAGVYSCTATNEVGRAETSARVAVLVTTPPPAAKLPQVIAPETPYSKEPLFITKPRSTEAVEGDTVIIHCEVVGDPKPEVMWLRDWLKPDYYRDHPHFRRVGEGPEFRLEIPRAKLDYTGAYSVIAKNCHGEAKAVISLQIYAKGQGKEETMDHGSVKHGKVQTLPVIRRELKDLRCCDGDAVTLECRVHATPTPDIRWERGGRLLPLGDDFAAEFDGETARLSILQVFPEDEGEYTCVAYNDLGRAYTSACLVVDVPEEKETLLSRQLSRPPGLLSAGSTPRSTPRTTPSRSKSPSVSRFRERETTPTSRPRRLKVAAPKFYAIPHNRVAEEGETVRFQCAIAGHPTPWVTWDKDGLLATPSARLTVTERDDLRVLEVVEVMPEDAGLYRVTLENEVGRVEASARLEVIGRYGSHSRGVRAWSASPRTSPTFGRRLVGSAARVGGRLALACDLRGSPTPVTTWYRNGELVVRSERVTPSWDGRTARLDVDALEPDDAGVYTCVAENEAGKTRCSAKVDILDVDDPSDIDRQPPEFLQGLPECTVALDGQPLELQVRLKGTPPIDVVWVKDDAEIPDCEDFRYVDYDDGLVALRLADVFPQDEGRYRCEAYGPHGDAVTCGQVAVRESSTEDSAAPRLHFAKRPTPVLAVPGGSAAFCCRLVSDDPASIPSWTVAGRPARGCARFKVEQQGQVSILHVSPVEHADAGQVTCTARSGAESVSCAAELSVMPANGDARRSTRSRSLSPESLCDAMLDDGEGTPAMVLRGPSDTTALRGGRVMLKATFVGCPMPEVHWLRAGHMLTANGRVSITTDAGVSCLALDDITADDSGKYVVSVENALGADCYYASVAVEGPPDPPAGRPTVSEGESGAVVAWSSAPYDGGRMVTGYSLEMRALRDEDWKEVANGCHSLSHLVRGLTPGEQYLFRVRAENFHGLSNPSFETAPFQLGHAGDEEAEDECFSPSFEPRLVTVELGDAFKSHYEVLEELGKGRYGVVHKVAERTSGQKFAAKFIRCIKSKDREKVQEEIDIMNCLRHPKLLQLAAAFESAREVVMVMEYISGGELFERVVADDFTLTERDCILFMRQICEGVDYMHLNYVVHLDLKPENIMCHTRTSHQIKLIDFGLARKLQPDTPVRVLFGTPEFIPPEIINYEPIGVESDMWSVGVICYVLLSGLSPFMGDTDAETFANITRADYDFEDEAFDAISQDAKDFISNLLVNRKEKRLTAKECMHHIWLAQKDDSMSCVRLSTDKLKKFIIRRKWQKTGNAIRALGRMATLSAASRRNSNASSTSGSPRPSLSGSGVSRMSSLNEEDRDADPKHLNVLKRQPA